jgi:hypothetical protein
MNIQLSSRLRLATLSRRSPGTLSALFPQKLAAGECQSLNSSEGRKKPSHCERSEAIQATQNWIASSLRSSR